MGFRDLYNAVAVGAGPSGPTKVLLRLEESGFDILQHLLGREPITCLLAKYGDIDHPSRLVTQLVQIPAGPSTLPILSLLLTDREDLTEDVFALLSSSR